MSIVATWREDSIPTEVTKKFCELFGKVVQKVASGVPKEASFDDLLL